MIWLRFASASVSRAWAGPACHAKVCRRMYAGTCQLPCCNTPRPLGSAPHQRPLWPHPGDVASLRCRRMPQPQQCVGSATPSRCSASSLRSSAPAALRSAKLLGEVREDPGPPAAVVTAPLPQPGTVTGHGSGPTALGSGCGAADHRREIVWLHLPAMVSTTPSPLPRGVAAVATQRGWWWRERGTAMRSLVLHSDGVGCSCLSRQAAWCEAARMTRRRRWAHARCMRCAAGVGGCCGSRRRTGRQPAGAHDHLRSRQAV